MRARVLVEGRERGERGFRELQYEGIRRIPWINSYFPIKNHELSSIDSSVSNVIKRTHGETRDDTQFS